MAGTAQLEDVFGYLYRGAADMQRIAEGAGIDPTLLSLQGSPVTAWHSVMALAESEGRLGDLYAQVSKEHPRNKELAAAWAAYQAAATPQSAQPVQYRPPRGQDGIALSDYRTDSRIDALQKEVGDLKAVVARLESTLTYMISQNNALSEQNKAILRVLDERVESAELPHALQWYAVGLVLTVIAVFAIVYFGGHV